MRNVGKNTAGGTAAGDNNTSSYQGRGADRSPHRTKGGGAGGKRKNQLHVSKDGIMQTTASGGSNSLHQHHQPISSRSNSKPVTRKSHSIKHKSSKLVQIPIQKAQLMGNSLTKESGNGDQNHNRSVNVNDTIQGINVIQTGQDQEYQFVRNDLQSSQGQAAAVAKSPTAYTNPPIREAAVHQQSRSQAKMHNKHRKLSKQPSGSGGGGGGYPVQQKETTSPRNNESGGASGHLLTLHAALHGTKQLHNEVLQSVQGAMDSTNFQQMMIQNTFKAQKPEFIISGTYSGNKTAQDSNIHKQTSKKYGLGGGQIKAGSQNPAEATPQLFNQDKQAKLINNAPGGQSLNAAAVAAQAALAAQVKDTRLANSGKYVINNKGTTSVIATIQQAPLFTHQIDRQQLMLQQQARQQQNQRQHLLNINLEIKGITKPGDSAFNDHQASFSVGTAAKQQPIPKQPIIASNLSSTVTMQIPVVQSGSSPQHQMPGKSQNIFVHNPPSQQMQQQHYHHHQQLQKTHIVKSSDMLDQQQHQHQQHQQQNKMLNRESLQNSHSPFKIKSAKIAKQPQTSGSNWHQTAAAFIESNETMPATSPIMTMSNKKKVNEGKNQSRKHSANGHYSSSSRQKITESTAAGIGNKNNRNSIQLQQLNHPSTLTTYPPTITTSNIVVLPSAAEKPQSSFNHGHGSELLQQHQRKDLVSLTQKTLGGPSTVPLPAGHIVSVPHGAVITNNNTNPATQSLKIQQHQQTSAQKLLLQGTTSTTSADAAAAAAARTTTKATGEKHYLVTVAHNDSSPVKDKIKLLQQETLAMATSHEMATTAYQKHSSANINSSGVVGATAPTRKVLKSQSSHNVVSSGSKRRNGAKLADANNRSSIKVHSQQQSDNHQSSQKMVGRLPQKRGGGGQAGQQHPQHHHHHGVHAMPGQDLSLQKSGKQIVQGQQAYYGHVQPSGGHRLKIQEQIAGTNKTLPLSVFEMQFYHGDFVMQQKGGGQGGFVHVPAAVTKGAFQTHAAGPHQQPSGGNQVVQQQQQQPSSLSTKSALGQTHLNHSAQKSGAAAAAGSTKAGGTTSSQLQETSSIERQKINFTALQNFHQQWLSTHGTNVQQQSQPIRNFNSSLSTLTGVQQQQQQPLPQNQYQAQKWVSSNGGNNATGPSPNKQFHLIHKHAGLQTQAVATAPSQQQQQQQQTNIPVTMQTLLQQQKLTGQSSLNHQQQLQGSNSAVSITQTKSQGNLYGTGATMAYQMVGFTPNFSQLAINNMQQNQQQQQVNNGGVTGQDQSSFTVATALQNQQYQTAIQCGQGIIDTNQGSSTLNAEAYQQQLYMLQLQAHQQSQLVQQEQKRARRDTNIFKRVVSKIPFENAYVEDCYKFIIGYGNNCNLIRNAFKQRNWWIEIQPVHSMFNFKWNPVSDGIKFARLGHQDPGKREQNSTMGQKPYKDAKDGAQTSTQDKINLQMVNHLENHQLLTEKYNLLMVMQRFCDLHKESAFDLMPITFFVEISDASKEQHVTQALSSFVNFWQALEANKEKLGKLKETLIRQLHHKVELEEREATEAANGGTTNKNNEKANAALQDKIQRLESVTGAQPSQPTSTGKITKFKTFNFEKRTYQKYTMPLCHFDSFNLWLLKPTHLNRGRGIHVFNDLDTLHKLIKQYCTGKEELPTKKREQQPKENPEKPLDHQTGGDVEDQTVPPLPGVDSDQEETPTGGVLASSSADKKSLSPSKKVASSGSNKIKHNTFIIQKYIERPLLIFKRKFDIRVWVLLDQDHNAFFFKEGYLRTSSSEFGIDLQNIDNAFVHLTNNAVQKYADNYGDFEDGNQLTFQRFQEYIEEFYPESGVNVYDHLVPQMEEIVVKTFNAVRKTIDPNRRKHCFELFGYDFILDEEFNSWLIEVNTNPCMEESSELLKKLLPRMIEDMMRLTVDVVFPKSGIRRRKDTKKKGTSPTKVGKGDGLGGQSPVKRMSTANKRSVQLQTQEDHSKAGGQTDTEQTPLHGKGGHFRTGSKTNSSDATTAAGELTNKLGNPTSEGGVDTSQSILEADINRDEEKPADLGTQQQKLMVIKEKQSNPNGRTNPVPGYSDSENMWRKLINIEKDNFSTVTKHPNNKSVFSIQVQDKIFKLRKNPAYTGPLNLPVLQPDPAELLSSANAEQEETLGDEGTKEDTVEGETETITE